MDWIKRIDKQPREGQLCLVAYPQSIRNTESRFCYDLAYFCNGQFDSTDDENLAHQTTHWMPLPEPPKE